MNAKLEILAAAATTATTAASAAAEMTAAIAAAQAAFPDVSDNRAKTLAKIALANMTQDLEAIRRVAAAPLASWGGKIPVTTRYGHCSRGKCWGRDKAGKWAEKNGSKVFLTPGQWTVGSDDGFTRKERKGWVVTEILPGLLIAE